MNMIKGSSENIEILEYSSKDKDSVIALLSELWINLDEKERIKFFEWRYEKTPYNIKPIIFVAKVNKKIVGFRPCLPQLFEYKNKKYTVFFPADTIVQSDYRAQGLFFKLNERCIKAVNNLFHSDSLFLNLSSNDQSVKANLKQGWERMNRKKRYLFKFSAIGFMFRTFSKTMNYPPPVFKVNKNKKKIIISNELKVKEVVTLIDSLKNQDKINKIRDHNYFESYYLSSPKCNIFVYGYEKDQLSSFLSVKRATKSQYSIEEYYFKDIAVLRLSIKILLRKVKIPILRLQTFSQCDEDIFTQISFLREKKIILKILRKKRNHYLIRPAKLVLEESDFFLDKLDIRNIENWQLFESDIK